jgi:DNA polymerase-4
MAYDPHNNAGLDALAPWQGPAILLVDLDAFFASVEQLDHPEWRGKPVIVGGEAEKRGVVSTCSYEARAYGVHSAMPSAQARRLCPDAIWTVGNYPRYTELSKAVMSILLDASPHLQQVSIDEAFLDVTPGRYIDTHPALIAEQIRARIAELGITASIGAGVSKSVAKIASEMDNPNGLTIVYPGSEKGFLAPLPIRTMSGIGRSAEAKLHALGIDTLGALAQADEGVLKGIFGIRAHMMRMRCLGTDESPVETDDEVKSVSNEMTFSTDLLTAEEIRQAIAMVASKVARRLRRKGLAGYTVTLKVRYADLSIRTARRTLNHPVDDEHEFTPVLWELLGELWHPGDHLRLVGAGVSSFEARPEQMSLFDSTLQQNAAETGNAHADALGKAPTRALVEATDKVKDRFGDDALHYGREWQFHGRDTGTVAQKRDDYK